MIQMRNSVTVDFQGREIPVGHQRPFNLTANDGDIHQYATDCIIAHWHQEMEVFISTQGQVRIGIEDQEYLVKEGEGCFINSDILHSFTPVDSSPCTYHSFVFDTSIVGGAPGSVFDTSYVRPLLESGIPYLQFTPCKEDVPFYDNFNLAFEACRKEAPGYEFDVRTALSKILLFLNQKISPVSGAKASSIQKQHMKQMLLFIDRHLSESFGVAELAGSVNICERECQRIFQRYLHYRPMEYVRRKRIYTSAAKLLACDSPVTDVAFEYGFASPSHYTKQFRELMGMTPTEYRRLNLSAIQPPG
mgnify:FL=1